MAAIPTARCFQLGFVTSDYAACEEQLRALYAVPEFYVFTTVKLAILVYRNRPASCVANVAIGYSGETQIEIVEPISGDDLYAEFLNETGDGIYHVGLRVDDFDEAMDGANKAGIEVLQSGSIGADLGIRFAFLNTTATTGIVTELVYLTPQIDKLLRPTQKACVPTGSVKLETARHPQVFPLSSRTP